MITDKLYNIANYDCIPSHAVNFIKNLANDVELGKYKLSETDFVNVETYTTKLSTDAKFEAHKKYIDIQILVSGVERIYVENISKLTTSIDYNAEKDIMFYSNNVAESDYVTLDGSNFVVLYPHEAHAPQVSINDVQANVKKVVLKIAL